MLEIDVDLVAQRPGLLLIADKGFAGVALEKDLAELGITLLRPSRKREKKRFGEPMLKKVRQLRNGPWTIPGPSVPRNDDQGPGR